LADDISWKTAIEHTTGYAASDLALLADNATRKAMQAGDLIRERHLLEAVEETYSSIADWEQGVSNASTSTAQSRTD